MALLPSKELQDIRRFAWILFWMNIATFAINISPFLFGSFNIGMGFGCSQLLISLIPLCLSLWSLYQIKKIGGELLIKNEMEEEVDTTMFFTSIKNYLLVNIFSIAFSLIARQLVSLLFLGANFFSEVR